MNFDQIYEKLKNGSASAEEIAFLDAEIEKLRKINEDALTLTDEREAEMKAVRAAKKRHVVKTVFKYIIICIISLCVIAAAICAAIFIPACSAADKVDVVGRGDALAIAREYLSEMVEEDVSKYVVRDIDKEIRINGRLKNSVYVYEIRLRSMTGIEYTLEVSTKSGYVQITDIDRHKAY